MGKMTTKIAYRVKQIRGAGPIDMSTGLRP